MKSSTTFTLPKELIELRNSHKEGGIPSALGDTLTLLAQTINELKPEKILEIGTATGISGTAMLLASPTSRLTTIEINEDSYDRSVKTFSSFGCENRVKRILGDAGEVINFLNDTFDFIFLDGAKARYYDYLYDLNRLLKSGGVLFADNVLFRGYVADGVKFRHRDNTIVRNMREFIRLLTESPDYQTEVLRVGDGVLIAKKL